MATVVWEAAEPKRRANMNEMVGECCRGEGAFEAELVGGAVVPFYSCDYKLSPMRGEERGARGSCDRYCKLVGGVCRVDQSD